MVCDRVRRRKRFGEVQQVREVVGLNLGLMGSRGLVAAEIGARGYGIWV